MRHEAPGPLCSNAGVHCLPGVALAEHRVKGSIQLFAIGKMPEGLPDDEALVAGARTGQVLEKAIRFVIQHYLDPLRHGILPCRGLA